MKATFIALLALVVAVGCGGSKEKVVPKTQAKAKATPKAEYEFTIEFTPSNNDAQQVALTQKKVAEVMKSRLSHFGIEHFKVESTGTNRIIIQIPGISKGERNEVKRTIQRVASLRFQLVDLEVEYLPGIIVPGSTNLTDKFIADDGKQMERQVMVETKVQMGGEHLTRAFATRDSLTGAPAINFSLDATGAAIFQDVTSRNIGRRLAIVLVDLDENGTEQQELISAPTIQSAIGARGEITGIDTLSEAREIANILENPLSTPLKIVEERELENTKNSN